MSTWANSNVDRGAFKAGVEADVKAAQARVEAARQRVQQGTALFKSRCDAAVAKARADIEAAKSELNPWLPGSADKVKMNEAMNEL